MYHQMSTVIVFLSSCVVSFDVSHNQRDTQWSLRWHDVSCIAPAHISQGSLLETAARSPIRLRLVLGASMGIASFWFTCSLSN